ncbi:MAG TPA: hypothetical protein PKY77_00645 [Phycisphaerae bacterium]|nr:hypothetical protein [Phycisphaerae bacterium]HRY67638.1 hypothetical protein [Phycisphaerae bacterium]HSA25025.1 hypothetical protein [Phycisphaerae bacterium]
MSKLSYYFPFLIGIILGPVIAYFKLTELWASASDGWHLLMVPCALLAGVLGAALLQLLMIGLQGVIAGVIPVYRGRSIRGTSAVVIGLLILILNGVGLTVLLSLQTLRELPAGWFWFVSIAGIVSLVGFIGTYLWCLPNAVQDFVDEPL